MSDNLKAWEAMQKVDQKYTKQSNVGGHSQTSIATLYPIKVMTSQYGPIGGKWRFDITEERFDNTKPMMKAGEPLMIGDQVLWEQSHTVKVALIINEVKACEQFGHTKYRYMAGNGRIVVDEEAPKKSVSDAQKKCLSLLGVCADVYLGDFDDTQYRAESQDLINLEKADKSAELEQQQLEEILKEMDDGIKSMDMAPNVRAAKVIYSAKMRYFKPRLNQSMFPKFAAASKRAVQVLSDKMAEIEEKQQQEDSE